MGTRDPAPPEASDSAPSKASDPAGAVHGPIHDPVLREAWGRHVRSNPGTLAAAGLTAAALVRWLSGRRPGGVAAVGARGGGAG